MSSLKGPIGLFDSGAGGLLVLKHLKAAYPLENFIFLADTANFPYGEKDPETICTLALHCGKTLVDKGCRALVIGCNTAAAYALDLLQNELPIPVLGPINAAAREATLATQNGKIGVLATRATVRSNIYQNLLKNYDTMVIEAPLLAQLVQENQIDLLESALRHYLEPLLEKNIDTLLLGCTHYPHVEQYLKPFSLNIIDSSRCFIGDLAHLLKGETEILVTGPTLIERSDLYSTTV